MMPIFLALLIENGSTLVEHASDIYPVIGWLIVALLGIIATGIGLLVKLLKERLDEFKSSLKELSDDVNDHEVRISLLEREGSD